MYKHKPSGGYQIVKLILIDTFAFGVVVLLAPVTGLLWAIIVAAGLTYATYSVFRAIRAVVRQVPTALGYSDLAAQSANKSAAKVKIDPAVLSQPTQNSVIRL